MAEHTHIEWTDATWQVITGCSVVSPGCTNCYAMKLAGTRLRDHPSRAGLTIDSKAGPVWNGEVRLNEAWLTQPLTWKRPRRIFVCAHGDLFHESVPDEWIDRVFAVMALAPQHTFQLLTKRAARMRGYLDDPGRRDLVAAAVGRAFDRRSGPHLAIGASGRKSVAELCDSALPSRAGRVPSAARLSSDHNDDLGGEDDGRRPPRGVDPFQRPHPCRPDDQSPEREQGGQLARQSRTGDHVRAALSRGTHPERGADEAEGQPASENDFDGERRSRDSGPPEARDAGQGHRGEVQSESSRGVGDYLSPDLDAHLGAWPLPNVWLGVSAEDQARADERIPDLLATPAAVRFLSAEPLLGPIDLTRIHEVFDGGRGHSWESALNGKRFDPWSDGDTNGWPRLDWVIVGGESGPGARPMHPDWARQIRDDCAAAGVPFFFKQWGEWAAFYDRDFHDPDWRSVPDVDHQMGRGASRFLNLAGGIGFHGARLVALRNVGKRAAGRLLDGVTHDGMPGDR